VRVRTGVTPESAGNVEVTPASPDGFYPFGSLLFLRAVPSGDLKFLDWRPGAGGTSYLAANAQGAGSPLVELSVRSDDAFYVATFTANPITTVTSQPPGVLVAVDGLSAYTPRNFVWAEGTPHTISIENIQSINNTTARAAFVEWSNGQGRSHDHTATADGGTITALVKRRFEVIPDVDSLPLAGSEFARLSQIQILPISNGGFYDEGTELQASAVGTAAVPFANFYGDLGSNRTPQTLVVRDQHWVGANFLSPALFNQRGLLNQASQLPSPATPGAVMTLYSPEVGPEEPLILPAGSDGRYPITANGVRVTMGETPVEILRLFRNSVTILVPWDVGERPTVSITLRRPTIFFTRVLSAAPSSPGIFTADGLGSGQAAAANQDTSVNSPANPVFRGGEITFRATGLGRFAGQEGNANPPSGPLTPTQNIEAELGGVPVEVLAITTSDGQPGQYNVRVRVNDSVPSGDAVPAVIISGGSRSQFGVTVSVR
jgi:uncharacterized protein (TIGR03437 family)